MTTRQEWLLLALAYSSKPMTPVQIQKTMFLMEREAKQFVGEGFYKFVPYNYGPFDARIYHDLEDLEAKGLATSASSGRKWKVFAATPDGMYAASEIKDATNDRAADYLEKVVGWVCSRSFTTLVRSIYAKYPEFKANSVFTG